jgi:hypothetical protein
LSVIYLSPFQFFLPSHSASLLTVASAPCAGSSSCLHTFGMFSLLSFLLTPSFAARSPALSLKGTPLPHGIGRNDAWRGQAEDVMTQTRPHVALCFAFACHLAISSHLHAQRRCAPRPLHASPRRVPPGRPSSPHAPRCHPRSCACHLTVPLGLSHCRAPCAGFTLC